MSAVSALAVPSLSTVLPSFSAKDESVSPATMVTFFPPTNSSAPVLSGTLLFILASAAAVTSTDATDATIASVSFRAKT